MPIYPIGFMQGRLSPQVNGLIQAFPWMHWQNEFAVAEQIGLSIMEWTLDQHNLYINPLLTNDGQIEIRRLCKTHSVKIPSLTGDCFMQKPFWKADAKLGTALRNDFMAIANACKTLEITFIVVPLVDNGRLENLKQENEMIEFFKEQSDFFQSNNIRVIFESDFQPIELARLINRLDPTIFGINYDIGNSAALGYSPMEEFAAYGHRVMNVHIKDRLFGGSTVPLGSGNANFDAVFKELRRTKYKGNFILQTARALDSDHSSILAKYRDMTEAWLNN
ncbi:sugar phosphate isomerase/epimerase [bacterium]|nr:sugar phosphate isomerase/epimerase [bacterium]